MEQLALKYQQIYYELLPNWFLYTPEEYDYIQQKIGYSLYGMPNYNINALPIDNETTNLSTNWEYDKKSRKTITDIYAKILEYGTSKNINDKRVIYLGIIYNIAYNLNASNEDSNRIYALPIFKIKVDATTVWYIDNTARVYKSWQDYVENNTLPKCIMVIPKDGIYQCNPHVSVTRRSSTVWTHIIKSPVCGSALNTIDIASSVTSITATAAIGVTSIFTPLAPIVACAGFVTCVATGAWTIGRSVGNLVDRVTHKESISPLKGDALSAWLGITSSILSIGTNGGSIILSKAIAKGASISTAAKIAYNSVVISNATVNGCGIVYQGHRLIDQYQTHKKVDPADIVMFSWQVLFFSNSLVNIKLSHELIGNSNGTILEKFKNTLRLQRLQEEYNKIIGNSNSEGIIHRLTIASSMKTFLANHNMALQFKNGMIELNGIFLKDPFLVVEQLLKWGVKAIAISAGQSLLNKKILTKLKNVFVKLLIDFISKQPSALNKQSNDSSKLHSVFNEMANMDNSIQILKIIFKICIRLLEDEQYPAKLLQEAILFIWEYSKANLTQNAMDMCSPLQGNSALYNLLTNIITNVANCIDELVNDMYSAFHSYMSCKNHIRYL